MLPSLTLRVGTDAIEAEVLVWLLSPGGRPALSSFGWGSVRRALVVSASSNH